LSVSSLICRKTLIWIGLANSAVERLANVLSCVHQVASSALLPRPLFTSKPTCAAISDAMGQSRHFASQINSEVVTQGGKAAAPAIEPTRQLRIAAAVFPVRWLWDQRGGRLFEQTVRRQSRDGLSAGLFLSARGMPSSISLR
jgi:hypothetical protein